MSQKNQRTTTAKEQMLKKIRHSLLQSREHPYPHFEESPLYDAPNIPLEVLFAQQLTAASGKLVYCGDEFQLIENLVLLAEQQKLKRIYAWEPQLQQLLDQFEFPYYASSNSFAEVEAGITSCEVLVARNGSILVSNVSESGRRLGIFPPIHIVVARMSQLVLDIKDGLHHISHKYHPQIPSMISIITGPSRTADIEKTLVLGAHGPKELYVFLLDDTI